MRVNDVDYCMDNNGIIARFRMREIVHIQAGQCGNQIGAKVSTYTHAHTHAHRLCYVYWAIINANTLYTIVRKNESTQNTHTITKEEFVFNAIKTIKTGK